MLVPCIDDFVTMDMYQYKPMDLDKPSVRVLRLLKGGLRDEIQCELFEAWINQSERGVPYDALSYTWGTAEKTARIMIDGSILHITLNLYEALQHLRCEDEDRVLWIDAICINQDDLREKNTQVARMAYIYSSASQTVAYLGQASRATTMAVEFINQLSLLEDDSRQLSNMLYNEACRHQWAALGEILNNAYWTRVWIAQEIALSCNVVIQIMHHLIDLDVFRNAMLKLVDKYINNVHGDIHIFLPQLKLNAVWAILEARRRYQTKSKLKLDELLILFLSSNATEPKDKVYGVYGMCAEVLRNQLPLPNYFLPLSTVYVAAVQAVVRTSGNLNILSALNCPFASLVLPSWCPNFNGSSPACLPSMEPSWRCAGSKNLDVTFVEDRIMRVKGFILDNLERTFLTDSLHLDYASAWASEMKSSLRVMTWSPYGDESHRLAALYDTLTLESPSNVIYKARTALGRLSCADYEDREGESDIYSTWFIRRQLEEGSRPWLGDQSRRKHQNFAKHRRIALTKQGYICLLPETAMKGDEIVVLYGGRIPFCVRRAEYGGDGEAWRFIGDCYVHGLMRGEAMEMVNARPELERYFEFI